MARGTSVTNLLAMLYAEIGDAGQSNATRDTIMTAMMSNMQKKLATMYDWPFLEDRWYKDVAPTQQFVPYPTVNGNGQNTAINLERFPKVEVRWTEKWNPVEYGIGAEEYNALDWKLLQQASDPIQKWRMATNVTELANPNVFEVWPVPVTPQQIKFTGQRTLLPLVAGADVADLDDMAIVLLTAAKYLCRKKQADWEITAKEATRHLMYLRQAYPTVDRKLILGSGSGDREQRRLVGVLIATR